MTKYGICEKCNKWGEAPSDFRENKHFLKCECGSLMYLSRLNPREAGYQGRNKVIIKTTKQ